MLRKCKDCGLEANIKEELKLFVLDRNGGWKHNRQNLCYVCSYKRKKKNYKPEANWEYEIKKKFNVSADWYYNRLNEQKNRCAICKVHIDNIKRNHFCIDHCHSNGLVRGLLCMDCNTSLGKFKDDVSILNNAIAYLEQNIF